jgi:hypothetical protein
MIKLATRSALSDRASEGKVVVIDRWAFDGPKTKDAKAALSSLGVEGRVLVVIDSWESPTALSFRNLPEVQLIKVGELNAYDILCNDWIVFEQAHLPTADTVSKAAVEPETEEAIVAVHGEDPAEGARDLEDDTRSAETRGSLEHGEPEASWEAGEAGSEHEEDENS